MGFKDAMKAANLNFGKVESADFEAAYITLKDDHFMIASAKETYEFYKQDVACFKPLSTGDNWIKWLMKFQDGKVAIITSDVIPPAQKGTGVSVAPIERHFGDLLFGTTSAGTAQRQQPVQTSRVPTEQQEEFGDENREEIAEEQPPIEETTSDDPMLKNLSAIKQLKELLDIGAITQKEFDEKKKLLLSSVGGENKYSISPNARSSGMENSKGLRIFNLILSILGIAAYVVGVVFLFTLEFRYLEGYNDAGQQIWTYMPFHIATFSWSEVGPRNATLCMFTFFGAIFMAASLIFKLITEIKQGKHTRKLIVWDIVTILISAVSIVFSAILVDWAKPGVKMFLILAASCAIAVFVHLLLLLAKKFIEFVRSK